MMRRAFTAVACIFVINQTYGLGEQDLIASHQLSADDPSAEALMAAQEAARAAAASSKAYASLPPLAAGSTKEAFRKDATKHEKAKQLAEEKAAIARKAYEKAQSVLGSTHNIKKASMTSGQLSETALASMTPSEVHLSETTKKKPKNEQPGIAEALAKVRKRQQKFSEDLRQDEFKQQSMARHQARTDKEETELLQRLQIETRLRKTNEQYEAGVIEKLRERLHDNKERLHDNKAEKVKARVSDKKQPHDNTAPPNLDEKLKAEKQELKEVQNKLDEKQLQLRRTEQQLSTNAERPREGKPAAQTPTPRKATQAHPPTPGTNDFNMLVAPEAQSGTRKHF